MKAFRGEVIRVKKNQDVTNTMQFARGNASLETRPPRKMEDKYKYLFTTMFWSAQHFYFQHIGGCYNEIQQKDKQSVNEQAILR